MLKVKYGKKSTIAIKIIVLIALILILIAAIGADMRYNDRIRPTGYFLIFIIATIIAFNNNLRIVFNTQNPINKALILISIFWILLFTTFLVVFSDYDNSDFFGREAMHGISAILFVPLFIAIGRWLHKIYKNSL
jgi:cell division protein FtsW (lipid II flippase)